MFTLDPNITSLLFCASIAVTYVSVRYYKGSLASSYPLALGTNSICFIVYAIARQNTPVQALINGIFLGFIFTTLTIWLGKLFNDLEHEQPATTSNVLPVGKLRHR